MSPVSAFDLVVLSADRNIEYALKGLLNDRTQALQIPRLNLAWITHPEHDPGCLRSADRLLAAFRSRAARCLVVFDHEGSGGETLARETCETEVEKKLADSGWDGPNCAAVAIAPEIEAWVWSDSPHVATALGWTNDGSMRTWLRGQGLLADGQLKPARPKEAVEAALWKVKKQRSSSIYAELARRVSLERCTDSSFARFKDILNRWFPPA